MTSPPSSRRTMPRAVLVLAALLAAAPLRAQVGGTTTPEAQGAEDGRAEGRMRGLERGADLGRAQALTEAWLRGFRRGLTQPARAWRDASIDEGLSEGARPGRAAGLDAGRQRGGEACAEAFARLQGRPAYRSEAPPPPPPAPPPPPFRACETPPGLALRFATGRTLTVAPHACDAQDSPLGWDVPKPEYPDITELRRRARDDGYENDQTVAWIRGYQDGFKTEWEDAFRQQRDTCPGEHLARWESDGEAAGRAEGARRRACDDFARGWERGFRDAFDAAFAQGFGEGWASADQLHSDNPVIRVERAVLVDENDDGVVEPGERLRAEVTLANAGLVAAEADVLRWEGVVSVAAAGTVNEPLLGQVRRDESLDLGRASAGAPFGAGLEVRLSPLNGEGGALRDTIGRPVVLEDVRADVQVRDGRLVVVVRPRLRSVATRETERDLSVVPSSDEGIRLALGRVAAGEVREPELVVTARPSWLADASEGHVDLVSGEQLWMRRPWRHEPRFGESVLTASRLPAGSAELDQALASLWRRLAAEYDEAVSDPKLYKRLEEGSDLAALASVLPQVPASARRIVDERLVRPLIERAEAKGTPRKVRRAVRALEENGVGSR